MAQKPTEGTTLRLLPVAGYGSLDVTTRRPQPLTREERRQEKVDILATISALRRGEQPIFPLLHVIKDCSDDVKTDDVWRLVIHETAFYARFARVVRSGERVHVPREDVAFHLADAPECLRMFYAHLDMLVLNDYAYYIERREEVMDLPPTGEGLDDRTDKVLGPPQKRYLSYVLNFNGLETRHRRLANPLLRRALRPKSVLIVDAASTDEEDTHSDASDTPRISDITFLV